MHMRDRSTIFSCCDAKCAKWLVWHSVVIIHGFCLLHFREISLSCGCCLSATFIQLNFSFDCSLCRLSNYTCTLFCWIVMHTLYTIMPIPLLFISESEDFVLFLASNSYTKVIMKHTRASKPQILRDGNFVSSSSRFEKFPIIWAQFWLSLSISNLWLLIAWNYWLSVAVANSRL